MSEARVTIEVVESDVLEFAAHVLALKYAQHFYGSDQVVSKFLVAQGLVSSEEKLKPAPGACAWANTQRAIPATRVLFVGVPPLIRFGYTEIENWAVQVLRFTERDFSAAEHIAITLHGPGYGLDEIEALHAEVRGIVSAVQAGQAPPNLSRVSVVERNPARVERLQAALAELQVSTPPAARPPVPAPQMGSHPEPAEVPRGVSKPLPAPQVAGPEFDLTRPFRFNYDQSSSRDTEPMTLPSAEQVEHKPRAFVAMPFAPEMEDVFYYGIQNPVRQFGYICERVDQEAFTGDILQQVKLRIENAEIVIADLTGANPNVYLEVGYAWGKARPTVLVANKKDDLRFDVSGQRCLKYQSIKDLEKQLSAELENLAGKRKSN